MSDLQCATSVVVLPAGPRVDLEALRRERPALLLSGIDGPVELAEALDLPVRRLADDDEPTTVERLTGLLSEVVDEYRGECVVVVIPAEVFTDLCARVLPAGSTPTGVLARVDDDGHRWAPWPSAAPE